MKCFYHPRLDAVGICNQCGKSGCSQCISQCDFLLLCSACVASRRSHVQTTVGDAPIKETQKAKSRVLAGWVIAGVVLGPGLMLGCVGVIADINDQSVPTFIQSATGTILAVIGISYLVWSTYWGVPPVWRWWRKTMGEILSDNSLSLFALLVGFCLIPLYFGYLYGAMGGGIYQYWKYRRIATQGAPLSAMEQASFGAVLAVVVTLGAVFIVSSTLNSSEIQKSSNGRRAFSGEQTTSTEQRQIPQSKQMFFNCGNEASIRSSQVVRETSYTLANRTNQTLTVFWLDYDGNRQRWFDVRPQEKVRQNTYTTHPWLVADSDGRCLRIFYAPAEVTIE
jgi:hypothetical protein